MRQEDTKGRILSAALELFSKRGYEAVTVEQIAQAVGIKAPSLYKHFKSKREIFDSIVEMEKERYLNQCKSITSDIRGIEAVKQNCLSMFQYQTTDESLVAFRRLLLLEKFKNPEIADIYKTFFVDIPLDNQIAIFEQLQKQGLMITGNTRVFAMELYAPFYLYHFVEYDPEKLISLFETHLEYFFKQHFIPEKKTT